jgi:cysteinyl-tRNA synthetase
MALSLYNTLTRKKELFTPIHPGKVGLYVCGPTVYDYCHLGHGRGYVDMDVLRRYLEYMGLEVRHIMNYTDVGHLVNDAEVGEDKLEKRAKAEQIDPITIANKYISACELDFQALNIKPAHFNPRPTQYVAQIIRFVQDLIDKGFAYEVNGSVYFSVAKFPEYGKLSGRRTEELEEGARVEVNPEKRDPIDFALWIKATPEHILRWDSPWSSGYPGWHIECSVMSCDLLGQDTFDIHGGGNQNVFPHNENEVAQSEAYLGKKMANFWTLWAMVNIDGIKMSKSLGNFTTIQDALKNHSAASIRLWVLSSHYRSIVNFNKDSISQSETNLRRITDFVHNLEALLASDSPTESQADFSITEIQQKFEAAMDDDLNTPLALSVLYELITETNKLFADNTIGKDGALVILAFWKKINSVFGLILPTAEEIPAEVLAVAEERKTARNNKDFSKSDELRQKIEGLGFTVEDIKDNNYVIKPRR